jgi:large subunit ribosomal protein L25
MSNVLNAKSRQESGKGSSRRLRTQGLVPAVVYGKHLETPVHISVDPVAVKKAIATPHRLNTLLTLKVEGGGEHQVLLKDYQQDPLTREVLHADFIDVQENQPVKVKLPVVLSGRSVGVAEGGILQQARREIEVWAVAKAIPEKLEVDVTALKINQALHVNDVALPEGVTVKSHVNFTLAVVSAPDREEAQAAAPAAAAPAAGAAAAAAAPAGKEAAKPAAKK